MARLLAYRWFGDPIYRIEEDDEKADREFLGMASSAEYTDIRLYHIDMVETSKLDYKRRPLDPQYVQGVKHVCLHVLETISPLVKGWPEGETPTWAKQLKELVPELQSILGIESITNGE